MPTNKNLDVTNIEFILPTVKKCRFFLFFYFSWAGDVRNVFFHFNLFFSFFFVIDASLFNQVCIASDSIIYY